MRSFRSLQSGIFLLCVVGCGAPTPRIGLQPDAALAEDGDPDASVGGGQAGGSVGGQGGVGGWGGGTIPSADASVFDSGTTDVVQPPAQNAAPVVSVQPASPSPAFAGTKVNLVATATDDGRPTSPGMLTLQWSKVSGPGQAAFAAPAAASTTVTFSLPGSYVVRVTANDGALQSMAEATVVVAPVSTALRSHVPFDEGQGTSAADEVAGNPAATAANANVWTAGKQGSAVNCTGIANTFSLPHSSTSPTTADDFTLSFWAKSTQTVGDQHYPVLLWKQTSAGRLEVILYKSAGGQTRIVFKLMEGNNPATADATEAAFSMDGQWHHVAARRYGSRLSLSVDGMLKSSTEIARAAISNTAPMLVCGIGDAWGQFIGAIDDVRQYGRALEDVEIQLISAGQH